MFPIELNEREYVDRSKHCDGICKTCGSWAFEKAEPLADNVYCDQCENRSVLGMNRAVIDGVIQVKFH